MEDWIKFTYIAHCRHSLKFPELNIGKYNYPVVNVIYMKALNRGVKMKLESREIIKTILRYLSDDRVF
jgi:hypothetical protein